jgi:hypothetical protein
VLCWTSIWELAGQLGDGRYKSNSCSTIKDIPLQLKGAGPTPYSRTNADGFVVLRSSIREYLCAEAMHYLEFLRHVRCRLCFWRSSIARCLYNGNPAYEKVQLFVEWRHLSAFGSFEICIKKKIIPISNYLLILQSEIISSYIK